jgi:hypothetical protein
MSGLTHDKLVKLGKAWLSRTHAIVITEMATIGEEPDVLGFKGGEATLIECKASRSDYYADKKKSFRAYPELGIGTYRYFLTPEKLLALEGVPEGWGVLETCGKRVRMVRSPRPFIQHNSRQEKVILMSALRRIARGVHRGISVRCYEYETQNTATLSLDTGSDWVGVDCPETEQEVA